MDVHTALEFCKDMKNVRARLQVLQSLGLGYLTLGEDTPNLSGGEAQRLKLASEMGKAQSDSVFVFDEPTVGLHPLDVRTLLGVFRTLIANGATVVVIEHDLDVIRSADYIIDMGSGRRRGGRADRPVGRAVGDRRLRGQRYGAVSAGLMRLCLQSCLFFCARAENGNCSRRLLTRCRGICRFASSGRPQEGLAARPVGPSERFCVPADEKRRRRSGR